MTNTLLQIAGGDDIDTLLQTSEEPDVNLARSILLADRLNDMTDEQIGDLLTKHIWAEMLPPEPRVGLVHQAVERLYRAQGAALEVDDSEPDA